MDTAKERKLLVVLSKLEECVSAGPASSSQSDELEARALVGEARDLLHALEVDPQTHDRVVLHRARLGRVERALHTKLQIKQRMNEDLGWSVQLANDGRDRLQKSRDVNTETLAVTQDILEQLQTQKEMIKNTRTRVDRVNESVDSSNGVLQAFKRWWGW